MRAAPEKEEGATGNVRGTQENYTVPAIYSSTAAFATVELQVARLTRRFKLEPPTARAVAILAYGGQP